VRAGGRGAADRGTDVERAQLTGTIAFGADVPFLRAEQALWTAPAPAKKPGMFGRLLARDGAPLVGEHSFPFSLALPETVSMTGAGTKQARACALPSSFEEKGARGSVAYRLVVTVRRGALGSQSTSVYDLSLLRYER
jgi:hypothetical protein